MKYPIGIQDFKSIIEDGYIYVDKTALIYDMVQNGKIYFLSRPRRFGKSLLISTLEYYFSGKKELFKGLAIDRLVFHIDFNSTVFQEGKALKEKLEKYVTVWEEQYGMEHDFKLGAGDRFKFLLEHVHHTTGKRSVVLIDEYDKPLLDTNAMMRDDNGNEMRIEDYNRNILKGFYSTFKAADADLRFVLLTGVTKFSQVSVFSGFNQPEDISMSMQFDALCGITADEMEEVFGKEIDGMAEEYGVSAEEMRQMLKKQYDGYHFSRRLTDIYNPFSVLNALKSRDLDDFWFASGTPTFLIRLLAHTKENLNELTGRYYDASDFFGSSTSPIASILQIAYQYGYLTIKGYNRLTSTYLLDYPNKEVKDVFISSAPISRRRRERLTDGK